jgi:hypothetical protein
MRWLRQHQASPMPLLLGVQTEVWRRERNRRQTSINLLSCYFLLKGMLRKKLDLFSLLSSLL